MKERYELIQLNKVNDNHRKYTKESFTNLPDNVPVYFGRDTYTIPSEQDSDYIVGEASNFKIDGQMVICDINLFDKKIKELKKAAAPLYCTSTGVGKIHNSVLQDFSLKCIDLCSCSAFKDIRNKIVFKDKSSMEIE